MLRNCCQPCDFLMLLLFHLFIGLQDFSLFGEILSHLHDLVHVLVFEVNHLLESVLVHVYHLHVLAEVLMLILLLLILIWSAHVWNRLLVLLVRLLLVIESLLGVIGKF